MTRETSKQPEDVVDLSFEDAYRMLEAVVAELETGEPALDDALTLYERGAALTERCNALLTAAELRVRQVDAAGNDAGPLDA